MKILIALLTLTALACSSCTTTKDATGNSTTTVNATGDAAIQAAIQIATVAATAAIQTYLANPGPHARLASNNPAIASAKQATATAIMQQLPSLTSAQVNRIVGNAYTKALRNHS